MLTGHTVGTLFVFSIFSEALDGIPRSVQLRQSFCCSGFGGGGRGFDPRRCAKNGSGELQHLFDPRRDTENGGIFFYKRKGSRNAMAPLCWSWAAGEGVRAPTRGRPYRRLGELGKGAAKGQRAPVRVSCLRF